MLVTLLPGADRDYVLKSLREVHTDAFNLNGGAAAVTDVIEWATKAVARLGTLLTAADVDRLVLTRGYERLLVAAGNLTAADNGTRRALNGMVSLELNQRVTALEDAIKALEAQIRRWSSSSLFAVPDTSFFIRHPDKVRDTDFGTVTSARSAPVTVLVPVVVVDELDRLKESKDKHVRWRAGHTLGVLDEAFAASTAPAQLHEAATVTSEEGVNVASAVTIEIVLDPPGHVRLPIDDDEIVDRCLAIEALAGRKVTLLTYDTGQSTRARFAGLQVVKLGRPPEDEASA